MATTILVKAGSGRRVRMPDNSIIADAPGAAAVLVVNNSFVARRLAAGDLVEVSAPAAPTAVRPSRPSRRTCARRR